MKDSLYKKVAVIAVIVFIGLCVYGWYVGGCHF